MLVHTALHECHSNNATIPMVLAKLAELAIITS